MHMDLSLPSPPHPMAIFAVGPQMTVGTSQNAKCVDEGFSGKIRQHQTEDQ